MLQPDRGWAQNIVEKLNNLAQVLSGVAFHCIVVNDGSVRGLKNEDTVLLQSKLTDFEWVSYSENRGKGHALREGIERTTAPVVLYTDVDFPYTLESMRKCLEPVLSGDADVSLAIRNTSYYTKLPRSRRLISKFLKGLNRNLLASRPRTPRVD